MEKKRPGANQPFPRWVKLEIKQLFNDQQRLAENTRVVVKKLDDAPVFQWVLYSSTEDMSEVALRLDKEESGQATQEIQEDIIKKLNDLAEAVRKERSKPQNGGGAGKGGGGGGGKQALVPPLAELKMLRIMQHDVNLRTKQIDEEVAKTQDGGADLSRDQRDRLRRAAVKEGEIARITAKIAKDMNGGNPPSPAEKK